MTLLDFHTFLFGDKFEDELRLSCVRADALLRLDDALEILTAASNLVIESATIGGKSTAASAA